jgi:haloalkane dehalogenase
MTSAAPLVAPEWVDRTAYPFTSRWADLPFGSLHYVDEGRGDTLLFAHGTPTWSFEFRHLIAALSRRYRCVAPDHLGFGLSDRPVDAVYTPEAHADRFQAFATHLGLDRVTLIVHDYGGPIGLPLALADRSRVTRVVLLNTWMWPFDNDPDMARKGKLASGVLGRVLYKYGNASLRLLMPSAYGDRSALTPAIHRQYLQPFRDRAARVRVLHALARAILASGPFYGRLYAQIERLRDNPALIVWGMKDIAFPPSQLTRWEEHLPEAEVVRLPLAGHWPHEEAPDEVLRAIDAFLTRTASVAGHVR